MIGRRRFIWSLSLYYAALFLLIGLQIPFLPLWLEWRGLSPGQISVILTIPLAIRIVAAPAMTFAADRLSARTLALVIYSAAGAAAYLCYHLAEGFAAIALVTALVSIFLNPLIPIAEAVTMRGARLHGLDYGRIRLWGSIAFIGANIAGGAVVAAGGGPAALVALNVAAVLTALAALTLPRREAPAPASEAGGPPARLVDLFGLMRSGRFAAVLVGSAMVQASHAMYYAFGSIGWVAQGIPATTVGLLWAAGVVVEVALFAASTRVAAALGVRGMFAAGTTGAILRWALMSAAWPTAAFFPIQTLHALSFGMVHLATMHYLAATAPDRHAGGVQGLFVTLYGVIMAGATLAAGPLFRAWGEGGYAAMAGLAALGGAILIAGLRRYPQSSGAGGWTSPPS